MKIQHVAIIMDGNRRWAEKHDLPTKEGHKMGVEALERIVKVAIKEKVEYLTIFALSTENLENRAKTELKDLFSILQSGFTEKLPTLKKEGVRVEFFGDIQKLPLAVKRVIEYTKKQLAGGKRLQLNIAINYGSKAEILDAARKTQSNEVLDNRVFSNALYTSKLPDPDLLIRSGGQKRLSNFLLWQLAYSELYFSDKLWPDFNEEDFKEALEDFKVRKRNFGS